MGISKTTLVVHCLLVMSVGCLAVPPEGARIADGVNVDRIAEDADVDVSDGKSGMEMCNSDGKCMKINTDEVAKAAEQYKDMFKSAADLRKDSGSLQVEGSVAIPNANATTCPAFNALLSNVRRCPRCTWDDGDRCCSTCRYYSRLPRSIRGRDGRPCYVISFNGKYQYTLNGICRNPGQRCSSGFSIWNRYQCKQMYGVSSVVCLQVTWPRWYLTVQWYKHPTYCSCRRVQIRWPWLSASTSDVMAG